MRLHVGETRSVTVPVYERGTETPKDMTGKTLVVIFEGASPADVAVVPADDITIAGDDNNEVTFAVPAEVTNRPRLVSYAVRDDGPPSTVWACGTASVSASPRED